MEFGNKPDGHDDKLPLINREDELDELEHYKNQVRSGEGKTVILEGETGVGKTKLAEKILSICEDEGFTVLRSKCLYYESSEPYLPFYDVLEEQIQKKEEEDAKYGMGLALSGLSSSSDSAPMSLMGGSEVSDKSSAETSIADQRELMFNRISDILIEFSEENPVAFFLDDLHWIDESSAALLHHLARRVPENKIFLFGAYRFDEVKYSDKELPFEEVLRGMKDEDLVRIIKVSRLDQFSVSKFICDYVGVDDIPDDFTWTLYRESEGNPFYLSEILDEMLREGVFEPGSYLWKSGDELSNISVPTSIKEMTSRRIEKLDRNQKKVIYFAALIGTEFNFELLEKVMDIDVVQLLDIIEELVDQGIIEEMESSENEMYKFNHLQTRTSLLEEMGRSRKRVTHKKIGEAMEEFYSDQINEHLYDLSRHFYKGKYYDKAYEYSLNSGDEALNALDVPRSIEFYERALESLNKARGLKNKDKKETELLVKIGELYFDMGESEKSKKMFIDLLEKAKSLKDDELKALALRRLGHSYKNLEDYQKAKDYFEDAIELCQKIDDLKGLAEAYRGIGFVWWRSGEYEKAREHYQRAIEFAKKSGSNKELGLNYIDLGNVFAQTGKHDRAMSLYQKSIPILESLKLYDQIARVHNNLGDQYMKKEKYDNAIKHFDKCIEESDKIGNDVLWAWGSFNAAEASVRNGDINNAKEYLKGIPELMDELRESLGVASSLRVKGMIIREEGDLQKAINLFERSKEIMDEIKVPLNRGEVLLELGEVYKEKGDYEKARENLYEAKDCFGKDNAPESYLERVEDNIDEIESN